ncbi:serine hydrolase domain-containing protein [Actinosynnema sp. NPDC023587]|uniref:serine hydrolase domain-containing protein n=1 Tax=Actinosynnema sp. NPDC023587 TaxID=3154695 RepID=UPI00340C83D3
MVDVDPDLLAGDRWQARLDDLAARHRVPGFQVGLLTPDGGVRVLAAGLAGLATGVEVTPHTLFHYGSITKVWITTLVLQLVDEGLLTLDAKVVDVLPDFRLADPEHGPAITVRHLLTHTSGIDGDLFTDTGDDDGCLEGYVASLADAAAVTGAGGPLSYSNSGFCVAGRIVEVLRGTTWNAVLAERICAPLELSRVITLTRDAPLFRTAIGHLRHPETGELMPTPNWQLPRSLGPAGLITGDSADLLRFTAAHLRDGVGLNGERVLSAESARLMRSVQVDLSGLLSTRIGWGLGWTLSDWGAAVAVEHNGSTSGQLAALHSFPELGVAVCVLTNSEYGPALTDELVDLVGADLGLTRPRPAADPEAAQVDLAAVAGVYETPSLRCALTVQEGGLVLRITDKASGGGPAPCAVTPLARDRFEFELNGATREFALLTHDGVDHVFAGRLFRRTG